MFICMKIFLFSDYHGAQNMLEKLPKLIEESKPDLIVFCGDIVKGYARGNEWLAARADSREPDKNLPDIADETKEDMALYEEFYSILGSLDVPVYVVPGNMDAPKSRYLTAFKAAQVKYKNIFSIHKSHETFNDVIFTGFGGEISSRQSEDFFVCIYNEDEVIEGLMKSPRTVYVTHTPPFSNKVDMDRSVHKGNRVLNEVLERMKPIAHFCGHAHGGRGTEQIGKATIVNPGAFKSGNFAIVFLNPEEKQIKVQFKSCHLMKL